MKRLLIDSSFFQTRIVLAQDDEPIEMFYESKKQKSIVGNIYAGRIVSVLKGMQACFVDIGEEKNAYLPLGGQKKIKANSTMCVQVEKDAYGQKGAVLTDRISFTGTFVVLIPNDKGFGISKKITDQNERDRIFNIMQEIVPDGFGLIIRTEGFGKSREEFKKEIDELILSAEAVEKADFIKAPCLLRSDDDTVIRAIRELFTSDVDEMIINDTHYYDKALKSIRQYPEKIKLYEQNIPLFEYYGIESKLEKLYQNKVWLKSGGFIIIEQTEACVVIDVNTGKFTGKKDIQETFLKTNLEAADEIAHQIRLRNLSGIIIIDFIDMKYSENREILQKRLENDVKHDRIKTTVVGMTKLGLMQITRKKTSIPLLMQMSDSCLCCKGRGFVPSAEYTAGKVLREIVSLFSSTLFRKVTVSSNKYIISALSVNNRAYINEIENKFHAKIVLKEIDTAAFDYVDIEKSASEVKYRTDKKN
ncbi:MAG: Rne/Rng family ribonuclease [Clostridia bacterium]|nr:Rne/Rng family ribonuclease [Clostridia bacterium]MCI2014694.1 Rne/Rng family ribonuclease [Clostridia bacterium]